MFDCIKIHTVQIKHSPTLGYGTYNIQSTYLLMITIDVAAFMLMVTLLPHYHLCTYSYWHACHPHRYFPVHNCHCIHCYNGCCSYCVEE